MIVRRRHCLHAGLCLLAFTSVSVNTGAAAAQTPHRIHRLIVLGVDGMDPHFVERHWNDLPASIFVAFGDQGSLSHASRDHYTSATRPVAWSTFITGTDPAAARHLRLRPP